MSIKQQRQFGQYLPGELYYRGGVCIKLKGDVPVSVFDEETYGNELFEILPVTKESYSGDNHLYRCKDERIRRLAQLLSYSEMCFIDTHYDVPVMGDTCVDLFIKLLDTVGESRFRSYAWSLYDLVEDIILCTLGEPAYVETLDSGERYVSSSNLPILFTNEVLSVFDKFGLKTLDVGDAIDTHVNLYHEYPTNILTKGLVIESVLMNQEEGYLRFDLVNHN